MLDKQLEVLNEAFRLFNALKFNNELTPPTITIQSKGKTNSYGWCTTEKAWYTEDKEFYEINFSAEHMNRSYTAIMETLLHEMCHLSNLTKGIEDCSRKQNHNEKFKVEAERVGMKVEKIKQYGWAVTNFTEELKQLVLSWELDQSVFNLARKEKSIKKVTRANKKIKMCCPCCKTTISSDEEIVIICGECGSKFVKK